MRAMIIAIVLAVTCLGASADIVSGNGKVTTERRTVSAFSSISVGGSGILRVHKGPQKVEVTCDSNIAPYVTTNVIGGRLDIGFKPFTSILGLTKLQYDITLPSLEAVTLAGSGDAYIDAFSGESFTAGVAGSGGIKADLDYTSITLTVAGSGGFDATIRAKRLETRSTGSGDVYLRGSADTARLTISGSGRIGARDLTTKDTTVVVSGSGNVDIKATKTLDASLSGSGEVSYWGNPKISQRISGSGRVERAGD